MRLDVFVCVCLLFSLYPLERGLAQDYIINSDCENLGREENQDSQESAEYKPGVDVNGNAVAPAELENGAHEINYPIEIPVKIDALKYMDFEINPELKDAINSDAEFVTFKVYEDGRVEYNGVDVSNQISHHCMEKGEAQEVQKIMAEIARAHGQGGQDDVGSLPDVEPASGQEPKEELQNNIDKQKDE